MSNTYEYHDDPINLKQPKSKRRSRGVLALVAVLIGASFYIQTTLAANVSLSSGAVEFGQGILRTVACSGSQSLTITPSASFANASGSGTYKFSGFRVDNIPASCQDTDFAFSAYNDMAASAAQAIFNTSSTRAVVYMRSNNTFEVGGGGEGLSVTTNSSSSFTVNFTVPVAASSEIRNLTIESGAFTVFLNVGDTGPGGGKIFYVASTPFACGPTLATTCTYLEAAPSSGTNAWTDATYSWSGNTVNAVAGGTNDGIGYGFKNTVAIVDQAGGGSDAGKAGTISRAYRGPNNLNDWFLPSKDELNQIYVERVTIGGSGSSYWSSSEISATNSSIQSLGVPGQQSNFPKSANFLVRPIRAF
jgi:hypothetical protein